MDGRRIDTIEVENYDGPCHPGTPHCNLKQGPAMETNRLPHDWPCTPATPDCRPCNPENPNC